MRGIRSGLLLHMFRGLCVCFFVEHNRGPYKNGRIDRCIVSYVDTLRSKETRIGWGAGSPRGCGTFEGHTCHIPNYFQTISS